MYIIYTYSIQDRLLDKVVSNLTLPSVELQTACTELLKCIFECKGDRLASCDVLSVYIPICL